MEPGSFEEYVSTTLVLRAAITILFGIAAVFWPHVTILTIVYLFSTYILLIGIIYIVEGLIAKGDMARQLFDLLVGAVAVGIGVYMLRHTALSFTTMILLIGFMLIIHGILQIAALFVQKQAVSMHMFSLLGGFVSTIAGIVLLFQPSSAGVAFVWILGVYALITGPILIAMASELRSSAIAAKKR
jgi:uncharacterized membrane protein HdeD (DUF308 family)